MNGIHTFWDEEKQRSELHFHGHVLYGTNEDTCAVMAELHRLFQVSADLRLHIGEIDKAVSAAWNRAVRE